MSTLKEQLLHRFRSANIVEKIIFINIAVFILGFVVQSFSFLMKWDEEALFNWFSLPANFNVFLTKPWTIISYGFLHDGFFHILFNLLILFYIGNLFLDFFSKRDFLIYYFAGVILGGAVYMFSYNYFLALDPNNTYLVGASAGVIAVLVGIAAKIPHYALHFRFIGRIKLWYIAAALVILDIAQIPISNTGGHLAHLGGALTGFVLTHQINKGKNISLFLSNLFKTKKQKPLKTVYKKPNASKPIKTDQAHQEKIDAILDKISKSGYEALTPEEKDFLFSVGKK